MPGTSVTEYACVVAWQGEFTPVMLPGAAGTGLTVMARLEDAAVPQRLEGTTLIVPLPAPILTFIELLPCPEEITEPEGTVQV